MREDTTPKSDFRIGFCSYQPCPGATIQNGDWTTKIADSCDYAVRTLYPHLQLTANLDTVFCYREQDSNGLFASAHDVSSYGTQVDP
jgi:hypothetical protein